MTPPDANTALVLIDIQQGLRDDTYWGPRNNPDAETNAGQLLAAWRSLRMPVVHIHHNSVNPASPLRPGHPGNAPAPEVAPGPGEQVFTKTVNSAFIGTGLEQWLRQRGIGRLVIAGLTTNHCISTSVRMAGNLGFSPLLVEDACAANDRTGPDGRTWTAEVIHAVSIASLHDEFAEIATTDDVLASLPQVQTA